MGTVQYFSRKRRWVSFIHYGYILFNCIITVDHHWFNLKQIIFTQLPEAMVGARDGGIGRARGNLNKQNDSGQSTEVPATRAGEPFALPSTTAEHTRAGCGLNGLLDRRKTDARCFLILVYLMLGIIHVFMSPLTCI